MAEMEARRDQVIWDKYMSSKVKYKFYRVVTPTLFYREDVDVSKCTCSKLDEVWESSY